MNKLRQYYLPLIIALIGGLAIGMLPISSGLAGNQPSCFNNTNSTPSVRLAVGGQQINTACLVTLNNTLIVSATNIPAQNGTALLNAMTTIIVASPTSTNPWLLKLEPGTYDLGNVSLTMQAYVQVEGSGEGATTIIGNGQTVSTTGVIVGASNSELRSLTVQSRSGNSFSTGIYNASGVDSSFKVHNVTILSSGGSTNGTGIYNNVGSPTLDNLTVVVSNTTAGNSYGISNDSNSSQIQNTRVTTRNSGTGQAIAVYNFGSTTVLLKNAIVSASTTGSGASEGIWNDNTGTPLIQSTNVIVNNTGGGEALGILALGSSISQIEDSNISVTTVGSGFTQGMLNNSTTASIILRRSTIYSNGTRPTPPPPQCNVVGVNDFGGSVNIYDSHITVVAGGSCTAYGLALQGTPNIISVVNSYIKSTNTGIFNSQINKPKIGSSQLDAPIMVAAANTAVCIGSFRGDFTATNADCS